MHGKVKLARNSESGDNVAIKIIPRFSKKRRLGKLTGLAPQDKTKREIAILKKIRHPNVVALLEVIDDPELKKIYMVLEHVELGEIVWRKKGLPHICSHERRRVEREMRGEMPSAEEENYQLLLERRQRIKQIKRDRMAQNYHSASDYWSVEHGAADEASSYGQQSRIASREDFAVDDSVSGSRSSSRAPSQPNSFRSNDHLFDLDHEDEDENEDMETPGPLRSNPSSSAALAGTSYYSQAEQSFRGRSPSMADSIISHMSSVDFNPESHDAFADDFSYVPCFTFQQARSTFRDTVLGLEYLHYQGVVHRDIKPANLLWTREHRVKISDFGVSYFGRPIRDGEADDTVSESEARDFDDDLELAKTVGTPAFFAPELCYTDIEQEQPKVSEQIDVWSLGVTLYCLIFARIPFLAEDEFQMFRKIATEEVYIPDRRLKPVDPSTSPAVTSLYKRQNLDPYRDDNDLEYEEVDHSLLDLIRQMLIKNPDKRIRLRDIKRHPWVTEDLPNVIGWLDDSDPARPTEGQKIQVDERDMSYAVVPLAILERARTMGRKVLNKVMHPLGDRSESRSRHRANSSTASSTGDSMLANVSTTPGPAADRRRSLHPDDYFATAIQESLAQQDYKSSSSGQDNARYNNAAYDPLATVLRASDTPREHSRSGSAAAAFEHSAMPSRTMSAHRYAHSIGRITRQPGNHLWMPPGALTVPATPIEDGRHMVRPAPADALAKLQSMKVGGEDVSRSNSVDRGLFASPDKRAHAQVALNPAVVPGSIQPALNSRPSTPADAGPSPRRAFMASPPSLIHQSSDSRASYQHSQPQSDPDLQHRPQVIVEDRPQTSHRVERFIHHKSSASQPQVPSSPRSFAEAQAAVYKKRQHELAQSQLHQDYPGGSAGSSVATPDNEVWLAQTGGRDAEKCPSTDSMDMMGTPMTTPSDVTSPVSIGHGKKSSEAMAIFRSDPSLPALLSGASSVSADMEGELLGMPGVVSATTGMLLRTTDSLTPPAMAKEPTAGFPIADVFNNRSAMESGSLAVHLASAETPRGLGAEYLAHGDNNEEDDSSESDDGLLLMAKSKKKSIRSPSVSSSGTSSNLYEPRRRDTDMSIMSTDTVKKAPLQETFDSEANA